MEPEDVAAGVAAVVAAGVADGDEGVEGVELQTPQADWQPPAQKGAPVPQYPNWEQQLPGGQVLPLFWAPQVPSLDTAKRCLACNNTVMSTLS